MKQYLRRALAAALSVLMVTGLCCTAAFADFTYPSAYWKLHSAWDEAVSNKDADAVISVAQQTYDLLSKYEICTDICYNLEPKCGRAAWCSEMKGDIDGAIRWLKLQRQYAQWLNDNVKSYKDTLLNVDARLEYLQASQEAAIYVLTDQAGKSYPGTGAPTSGTLFGSNAAGTDHGESATLMYVTFGDSYSVQYWIDYNMKTYPKFAQAAQGGVIELAWNFATEGTAGAQQVLSADSYIAESLQAMGNLNATVLLRLGAEMNNWSDCDPATYIEAFRKVAQEAAKYDNVKMVFSPDNVSNRNVTFEDFYPGDQYVDWIGVSTYHNTNYSGEATSYTFDASGYGNDAYYGKGLYDSDPLVILRPLVRFAQEHNKPMMISECGFSYVNNSTGADLTSFAADQVNKFYSYVNMIYPQIKAVFYFDNTLSGAQYSYALDGNATVAAAYRSAIEKNGGYLSQGESSTQTWQKLSSLSGTQKGTLRLATYASFPGSAATSVTYYVDGEAVGTVSKAPYYYDLNLDSLSSGTHTIRAKATSGQFSRTTASTTITTLAPGQIFSDVAPGAWYAGFIKTVYEKGLFTGAGDGTFAPDANMDYAQFLTVLSQFSGETISGVAGGAWYDGYVNWAKEKGIIPEEMLANFNPTAAITRQDMAALFGAFLKAYNVSYDKVTEENCAYADAASIAGYAAEGVNVCYQAGIMSGGDDGSFAPMATATRAQVAVTMVQMARVMGR